MVSFYARTAAGRSQVALGESKSKGVRTRERASLDRGRSRPTRIPAQPVQLVVAKERITVCAELTEDNARTGRYKEL